MHAIWFNLGGVGGKEVSTPNIESSIILVTFLSSNNHGRSVDEELRRFQLNPQGFGQVFVSSVSTTQ